MEYYDTDMQAPFGEFYSSQGYLKFVSELHQRKIGRDRQVRTCTKF